MHLAEAEDRLGKAERIYLQPIDIWVARVAEQIWRDLHFSPSTMPAFRKRIADACWKAGVSGEAFNQGAWYLGSQVAGTPEEVEKVIRDIASAVERGTARE